MLFDHTRLLLIRELMRKDNMLQRHRHDVTQFGALCAVLRQHACAFTERVEVGETDIQFYITPHLQGDYFAIVEATRLMEAKRTISPHAKLFLRPGGPHAGGPGVLAFHVQQC